MSEELPSIMRTVTPKQSMSPTISESLGTVKNSIKERITDDGGTNVLRIILIVGIILFLLYNLYLYFYEGTDILGKYFGIGITKVSDTSKEIVNTVAEGTTDTIGLAEDVSKKGLDILSKGGKTISIRSESPLERSSKDKTELGEINENINEDSSYTNSLKKTNKGGYCYVGTDRTFRSCVKVDRGDVCMSNEIYPTRDICINPNLRR